MGDFVPPHNSEAEENVLGAMLISRKAIGRVVEVLGEEGDAFFLRSNQLLYRAMLALNRTGSPVDVVTVGSFLERRGRLEEVGGQAKLATLAQVVPSTGNVAHYARIVLELAEIRAVIRVTGAINRLAREPGERSNPELLDQAEQMFSELRLWKRRRSGEGKFRILTYGQLLHQYAEERGPDAPDPIRLGFGTLDAEMRGISRGQVCGVAARTAVGKTWLLNTVEHNVTANPDSGVLSLSLEMPGSEWAERALAIHSDVAPEQVEAWARQGELAGMSTEFERRMRNAMVCEDFVRLEEMGTLLDEARDRLPVPLRVVIVDYVGMLGADGRDVYERTSKVARGLKQVAKDHRVSMVVAMQLSRAGGNGSEPVDIQMLRDSGALEESMDFLIGAWRPGKDPKLTAGEQLMLRDVMRLRLLKNRKGEDGREVDVHFRPQSRKLVEHDAFH
jgi:replicative DNA helicase